jgi:Na+-translocating ferredoxin:NAD+ oxidoreductase RnfD subunit
MSIRNFFKTDKPVNFKLLALLPVLIMSLIFFADKLPLLYLIMFVSGLTFYFGLKFLFKFQEPVFKTDTLLIYYILVLGLIFPVNVNFVFYIYAVIILVFSYLIQKKFDIKIINPVILSWIIIFILSKNSFVFPEPSLIISEYSKKIPELITSATNFDLYFKYDKLLDFRRVLYGFGLGTPAELFHFAILTGLFLLVFTRTISYSILFPNLIVYIIGVYIFKLTGFKIMGKEIPNTLYFIFSGPYLFVTVFLLDDLFSISGNKILKLIYGFIFGLLNIILIYFLKTPVVCGYILVILPLCFVCIRKIRKFLFKIRSENTGS